jgi:hypothetical protein
MQASEGITPAGFGIDLNITIFAECVNYYCQYELAMQRYPTKERRKIVSFCQR